MPEQFNQNSSTAIRDVQHLTTALGQVSLSAGIRVRAWQETDFPAIQRLSNAEGWPSPSQRPAESLLAWQHSWPTLVATENDTVVGFVRALTDGSITMFIAEMLVDSQQRGRGIGRALLDVCHFLYPTTRIDLLSVDDARAFYQACGFRVIHDGMRKSYF
jgi:predicted N-acetyltransferase YhbS